MLNNWIDNRCCKVWSTLQLLSLLVCLFLSLQFVYNDRYCCKFVHDWTLPSTLSYSQESLSRSSFENWVQLYDARWKQYASTENERFPLDVRKVIWIQVTMFKFYRLLAFQAFWLYSHVPQIQIFAASWLQTSGPKVYTSACTDCVNVRWVSAKSNALVHCFESAYCPWID